MAERHVGEAAHHSMAARRESPAGAVDTVEAVLIALAAVIAAWAGYQTATWDSRSIVDFGQSARARADADLARNMAGQEMLYDSTTFTAWLAASQGGNASLAATLERRFRPEFRPAFDAWLQTQPFSNPSAPPGPLVMPQYVNARTQSAEAAEARSAQLFGAGAHARDVADGYLRVTVLLALVLFLAAFSQRLRAPRIRLAVTALAVCTMLASLAVLAGAGRG